MTKFLLAAAFFLVLLEIAVRAVFPLHEAPAFDRTRYSHMGFTPGAETPSSLGHASFTWASEPDGFDFVHALNLYGFRDREWTLEKPEGATRVAFVGDSFVEGFSASAEDTIPATFAVLGGDSVDVLNLGLGGGDLPAYARLLRDAVPLFEPNDVILVIFANDVLPTRFDPAWLAGAVEPTRTGVWTPRLYTVVRDITSGRRVPRRWQEPPFEFLPSVPDPRNPWTDGRTAGQLEAFVEPDIARAIRAGRFNPMLVDALPWFGRHLKRPFDIEGHLVALQSYLKEWDAALRVVYVPTKHQVTDRYLETQARFSPPGSVISLMGPEFQVQAALLAETCRALELPFLDLTPALRAAETSGDPLYWSYDDHMRPEGYREVGALVYAWWSGH
ncbi:MAG: hypothetical protein VX546_10585 [Myxococcota bacterium]|nr:hypothetical protein [Myxococcota bacterium]